jgi:hypothetical protein
MLNSLTRVNLPTEARTYLDGLYTGTARLRVIKRYNDALQKSLEVKPISPTNNHTRRTRFKRNLGRN